MKNIDHKIDSHHQLGFGAIFVILIYIKIYSHIKNFSYMPSGISLIPINDDPSYSNNWSQLFDFLLPQKNLNEFAYKSKERISFYKAYGAFKSCEINFKENLISGIRKDFLKNFQKYIPHKSEDCVTIAIHLRCPCDLEILKGILSLPYQLFNQDYKIYDNCYEYYKLLFSCLINDIYSKHHNNKIVKLNIHSLCSDLELNELIILLNPNIEVKIFRTSAYLSFIDFIQSDHFIAGHSSFSYLALLLREANTYIRSGFRHYVPLNVFIIDESDIKKNYFGALKLPFLIINKFFIYSYYYLVSFLTFSKNFLLRRNDA